MHFVGRQGQVRTITRQTKYMLSTDYSQMYIVPFPGRIFGHTGKLYNSVCLGITQKM